LKARLSEDDIQDVVWQEASSWLFFDLVAVVAVVVVVVVLV
jgi:hypothetical protein